MKSMARSSKNQRNGDSSSSSRRRVRCRNWNKTNKCDDSNSLLLHVVIPGCKFLSSISTETMTVIAVVVLSSFIIMISRLNCFHVHYGLGGSLKNLESQGSIRGDGYTDFCFTGTGKITYDAEAIEILEENPRIKLEDLDLGFVFDIDEIGLDVSLMKTLGGRKTSSSSPAIVGKNSKVSIGKSANDVAFHVTGERIRNALQKREAEMPRPSVQI